LTQFREIEFVFVDGSEILIMHPYSEKTITAKILMQHNKLNALIFTQIIFLIK